MNKQYYERYQETMPDKINFVLGVKSREDFVLENLTEPVLEIGCSTGFNLRRIKDKGFCQIKGIDISEKAIKRAKKNNKDIEFECFDMEKKQLTKKYNTVLLLEVLEHVFDTNKFLKNINHCLNKKGVLIISLPNLLGVKDRVRFLFGDAGKLIGKHNEPHIRQFTTRTLEEKTRQFGFEKKEFYNNPRFPFLPASLRGSVLLAVIKTREIKKKVKANEYL